MTTRIAVLLATVHRPDDIARATRSVLQSEYPDFEIRIVDQSGDDRTQHSLAPILSEARVHYQRQANLGLSAALNLGAGSTQAEILAITGDDCQVRPDWLPELARILERNPRVAVVFGSVRATILAGSDGFVPGCLIDEEFIARDVADVSRLSGTTACMGVRRTAWEELGGFDEMLGVGAPLDSAEDLDLSLRALLAGNWVMQTPTVETEHLSPTLHRDRRTVIRRNWYGSGAAFAKALKLAPLRVTPALVRLVGRWLEGGSGVAATYGAKPARAVMLTGFTAGFATGLLRPIDRRRQHFRARPER